MNRSLYVGDPGRLARNALRAWVVITAGGIAFAAIATPLHFWLGERAALIVAAATVLPLSALVYWGLLDGRPAGVRIPVVRASLSEILKAIAGPERKGLDQRALAVSNVVFASFFLVIAAWANGPRVADSRISTAANIVIAVALLFNNLPSLIARPRR